VRRSSAGCVSQESISRRSRVVHVLVIRLTDAQTMRVALDTDTGVEVGAGPVNGLRSAAIVPGEHAALGGLT
jgi:hypothetical protein